VICLTAGDLTIQPPQFTITSKSAEFSTKDAMSDLWASSVLHQWRNRYFDIGIPTWVFSISVFGPELWLLYPETCAEGDQFELLGYDFCWLKLEIDVRGLLWGQFRIFVKEAAQKDRLCFVKHYQSNFIVYHTYSVNVLNSRTGSR
jgi:hypothetical protein